MSSKLSRQLLCKVSHCKIIVHTKAGLQLHSDGLMQAHNLGIKYPKYVFLTYEPQWWIIQNDDGSNVYKCSSEDIAEVLQFSLAVSHLYYYVCYDATWALAYALHEVVEDIDLHCEDELNDDSTGYEFCQMFTKFCRSDYNKIHSLMRKYLKTTNFTGSSVSL